MKTKIAWIPQKNIKKLVIMLKFFIVESVVLCQTWKNEVIIIWISESMYSRVFAIYKMNNINLIKCLKCVRKVTEKLFSSYQNSIELWYWISWMCNNMQHKKYQAYPGNMVLCQPRISWNLEYLKMVYLHKFISLNMFWILNSTDILWTSFTLRSWFFQGCLLTNAEYR